ncbi:hypothetical protein DIU31_032035 [Mucilaginibacter rubeus]|uniref:Uncharacterized protein n=1 Tax=Mucilaginibacter rubeus TaxID=2027860 RepID=A0AAE6MLM4_9SPHI|nr:MULTISPECIES: hypothetical protein [Mucilaginibacter]QEM07911.1 hypothetical protein DIU31_032035 [Mucilaginibacter rubeus]QEM20363.1 hypothetical protein DIU38_031640 [Mucilaginibacter gossypii]QTE42917.1 hypothetical protein J3L19_29015 [Mucilaginibacter rubeus]QTE49518.1 hypothetical protein J3L21_28975 [Mucilaginibacter rubeus]QTE54614.1 hypothetical protein J3L23_20600 [Mucilaginibacter rubeus]
MKISILPSIGKTALITSILALIALNYGFKAEMSEQEWLNWSNRCLNSSFNPTPDINLKKWEITLTSDYFLRLRKTYQHGKQEYFSFNLHRLTNVDYVGSDTTGAVKFNTQTDDIIVQTYEDPNGNIDSMATTFDLPVHNMSATKFDSLKNALHYFRTKGL